MKKEDDCTGKAVQGTEEILFTNASSVDSSKTQIGYQILPSACVRLYGLQTADLLQVQKRGPCKSGRCIQDEGGIYGDGKWREEV